MQGLQASVTSALADRYQIEHEIGAGGMAFVYLAQDLKHRRSVAIKVLRPEFAATLGADRFLREIEFAARLSHPHILPLFDSGAAGELLYYVMPFVAGESLRARLVREHRLQTEEALRLAREVASAIGFAHQLGIVHRDIKPENVLLADDIALVADFGIARALRSSTAAAAGRTGGTLTMAGMALGTPTYMSPEQFTADEVDARADIYSLGCVLYEMLAGEPPFTGPSIDVLLRQHLLAEPRMLTEVRSTVSVGVARVVAKALAKAPEDRFQTAAALSEAIATVVSGGTTPVPVEGEAVIRNNLPRQRTRFIGRERELAECARAIGETRLLTLTGIGGSGKTRLAVRLAESLLLSFPDGVWFVDLASLEDPARVAATVAEAFDVHEAPDAQILDTLRATLRGKRALILLDNCEHLLDATAAMVNALLDSDESVRFLATSREGLGVEGERLVAVRSMSLPADVRADVHAVEQSDAVQLFVDRARAARRDFAISSDNAATVAEICRRLDGIPLALELAAARVKVLSVEQIRSKLDDRFRLLTGGRSAVPRQQTLLAAIQWSWEQLTDEEQCFLQRLSVFSGGWSLESATAVVDPTSDEFHVLDVLVRLVEKSLVQVEQTDNEARYGLLETVRQFGLERLVDAGESDELRERHFAYFSARVERFHAERFVREEYWQRRLTREHDNLRAALAFVRARDPERYLELAGGLAYFWWGRSYMVEGREHIEAALEMTPPGPARHARARALQGVALIAATQGDVEPHQRSMREGLAMWRELDDPVGIAISLEALGWAHFFASEDEQAVASFEELLALQDQLGDPVLLNRARLAYGQTLVAVARTDEAREFARLVLAFGDATGDRRAEHSGFHFLADCALIDGNCADSLGFYVESLARAEAIGARFEMTAEVEGIAMSLAGLGDHESAVRLVAASRAEWARLGVDLHIRFWDGLHDRYMTPAREALGPGGTAAAERAGREMTFEAATADARAAAEAAVPLASVRAETSLAPAP